MSVLERYIARMNSATLRQSIREHVSDMVRDGWFYSLQFSFTEMACRNAQGQMMEDFAVRYRKDHNVDQTKEWHEFPTN